MKHRLLFTTILTFSTLAWSSNHSEQFKHSNPPLTQEELFKLAQTIATQNKVNNLEAKIADLEKRISTYTAKNSKTLLKNCKYFTYGLFWGTCIGAALTVFAGYNYFQKQGNLDFSMNLKFFKD